MPGDEDGSDPIEALRQSLRDEPGVEFAVAFGSQVTGDAHTSSDLDVGVKFDDGLSTHERFEKRCYLSGELQQDDGPFVDVADVETLPLDVTHDAVSGTFLTGDEDAFRRFKASVETAFDTQRDDIRRSQRDVIDRIADDGLHG